MAAIWTADVGGSILPVGSLDDLRSILSRTAGIAHQELWLTSPDGSRLCMLRSGSRALLMFQRSDADTGFTTRADGEVAGREMLKFTLANGQVDEYPASWTISAERAGETLQHFFRTGTRPPVVQWHDDGAN